MLSTLYVYVSLLSSGGSEALEGHHNGVDLEVRGVQVLQHARRGPRVGDILAAADLEEGRLGLDDHVVERGQHAPVAGGEELGPPMLAAVVRPDNPGLEDGDAGG